MMLRRGWRWNGCRVVFDANVSLVKQNDVSLFAIRDLTEAPTRGWGLVDGVVALQKKPVLFVVSSFYSLGCKNSISQMKGKWILKWKVSPDRLWIPSKGNTVREEWGREKGNDLCCNTKVLFTEGEQKDPVYDRLKTLSRKIYDLKLRAFGK